MIIDTNEIEHDFETMDADGLVLVNPSEIGVTIAHKLLDKESISKADVYYSTIQYLSEIIKIATDKSWTVLKENRNDIE